MPTYEYKCENCGDRFEFFQNITAERLTTCQKCGGHLRRLIGAGAGVIFKGGGFYCTDYKGKNASMAPHEHAGTPCKGCAGSEACPAAKPADK